MTDAEYQLMLSRESLDFALQSGRMGTWDIDLETNKLICSQVMLDLWGISQDEYNHDRSLFQSKVHPDDVDEMKAAIDYAIENRTIYELEYRIFPSAGEERWMLSRGRCTFAPDSCSPLRFAGIVYDITDKKKNDKELANANKARNDFFTIASHELKTPLTCMQLQIQVMQWQLKHISSEIFAVELNESLKKQEEHVLRISRIVDNILDESKISEGRLSLQIENFDLSEMVSTLLEQFKLTALWDRVEIVLTSSQTVRGNWDRFRLEQVLLNLLMNAIRYGDKKAIHVEVVNNGETASMIVRDHGIGIKPEDQLRVFQRFERANPEREINGMGLGLFISNNIVCAHGGEILLKSEPGKGSEFKMIIPCQLNAR